MTDTAGARPPARLRSLLTWQANRVNIIGGRLTAGRLPASGRSDFAVLAALEEFGDISQADLGRLLGLDRNVVNGIATRLDDRGQISRAIDPSDRRRNVVAITPQGREYLEELQAATDLVQAELATPLTEAEAEQLGVLLGKILDAHPALPS